jgi:hypothetical protein
MHLKKLVPIVGFCAVSLFSSSAMAQLWAKNCATNQCLDATTKATNGMVQVSDCDTSKIAQQWHQNSPWTKRLQNAYEGFGKPCLDMNAETSVVTNRCNKGLRSQKWTFADNGQVAPIQNQYWNKGNTGCIVVGQDGKVTAAKCNGDKSQDWYWVNVGDNTPCPGTMGNSRMKLPTMKLPITFKPICSITPPSVCVLDINECGHPSQCVCPLGYTYVPATGTCDKSFQDIPNSQGAPFPPIPPIEPPPCTYQPRVCTRDINKCGNPSICACAKGYSYNPATLSCDLVIK